MSAPHLARSAVLLLAMSLTAGRTPAQGNPGVREPEPAPLLRPLLRNELPFMFALGFYIAFDAARAFGAADVDRDGDLDLLIGNFSGRTVRLLLNDGDGRFSEGTPTHMPNITNQGQSRTSRCRLRQICRC